MTVGLVFVPSPGISHLLPTVELSKRLLEQDHNHCFSITILNMRLPSTNSSGVSATDTYIESVAASISDIRFIELPPVASSIGKDKGPEAFFSIFIDSHKTHVKEAISKLVSDFPSVPIAALVINLFATSMIDVASELGIPTYLYFTSGAAFLGLMLHLPTFHVTIPSEFDAVDWQIEIPGMSPMPPLAMPSPVLNKKSDGYEWFLYHCRRFRETKAIIVNTFAELEPVALEALREGKYLPDHPTPPVYTVGPLLALPEQAETKHACIEWLDEQPPGSVVFLCFGSMGSFPAPQVKEMAVGLERSGHRFLWSLRRASTEGGFNLPTDANLEEVLPEGFLDRTKGRGLVWPSFVPQAAILAHEAVGGFVSHCGWNSTLESLWFGVPILAWPLYAEQRFNAFRLVQDLGLAVDLKLDYRGGSLVSAEGLEKAVRCLMDGGDEGKKIRARAKEMCETTRKAVEVGGSSFTFLKQIVNELLTCGGLHPADK